MNHTDPQPSMEPVLAMRKQLEGSGLHEVKPLILELNRAAAVGADSFERAMLTVKVEAIMRAIDEAIGILDECR